MNPKRAYYAILGVILLLVMAIIGGAFAINNLLEQESAKALTPKAKVAALNKEQASLVQARKEIATYNNLYNISKVVVPESKDQAETVRQIVKLAAANNITLQSITFPSSNLGSGPTASGAVSAPAAGGGPAVGSNSSLSQLVPVPKISGVYDLQITVTSATNTATYPQLIGFLQSLENNRRTALVSTISITPDTTNHNLFSFRLTMDSYIKPEK